MIDTIDFQIIRPNERNIPTTFADIKMNINGNALENSALDLCWFLGTILSGHGKTYIFTCTCGSHGCADYFYPISVSSDENYIFIDATDDRATASTLGKDKLALNKAKTLEKVEKFISDLENLEQEYIYLESWNYPTLSYIVKEAAAAGLPLVAKLIADVRRFAVENQKIIDMVDSYSKFEGAKFQYIYKGEQVCADHDDGTWDEWYNMVYRFAGTSYTIGCDYEKIFNHIKNIADALVAKLETGKSQPLQMALKMNPSHRWMAVADYILVDDFDKYNTKLRIRDLSFLVKFPDGTIKAMPK